MSHGWRVVAFCFLAAVFTWGLGVFGAGVYLHEVTKARGWSVSLVSAAALMRRVFDLDVSPARARDRLQLIDRWRIRPWWGSSRT